MRKFWESIYCPNYISGYNPFILKDMNKAIENVSEAINSRKKIVIYGINTVDSICAIASLSLVLQYLNADVEYLIHDNENLDSKIDSINIKEKVDFLGAELLITLGIDIISDEVASLCKDLNIDIVVLENKETDEKKEYIYINPNQKGCQYRYKTLPLSLLSFKLMQAIAIYYNMKSINKYLDLIFLGTRWELYPKIIFKGENGIILKEGKGILENTKNIGLRAIIDYNNIENIEDGIDEIINFITPTISTVGMINNGRIILELLTTIDSDRAAQIVKYLHNISKQKN
ncbi:DHH family phosphoesterase [uncultured Clostridium sp.]|uniref:DHH family phosphoesterase n=1 Tax=uncultured Clostridium sp. TaxID=59620 RepID=UPI00262DACEB|nr:DHH family phosphoesterase [uncultured Clostridium sp.]